jgi:hypothetical protein
LSCDDINLTLWASANLTVHYLQQRFGASGVDGRTMGISNAAVQQSQRDVNYLALELNLYISISSGIGTGLDIIKFPT